MNSRGKVFYKDFFAGIIEENDDGYIFTYDPDYLLLKEAKQISVLLPLQKESFRSNTMFPFFDGIIPEGWLLDIARDNWKINPRDRMALLLKFCADTVGAVKVISEVEHD